MEARRNAFEDRKLSRVNSLIGPYNFPSQAVARRLGMTPEREMHFHGSRHILFSVSADWAK
jgi:RimJ/RimL family protein N-acetyltransferase